MALTRGMSDVEREELHETLDRLTAESPQRNATSLRWDTAAALVRPW